MCEAAGVPLERYEQAQHRVDKKQDEVNKFDCIVKRCEKQAKPLNRAIRGLRQRLQNCQAKIARLESGGVIAPERAAPAESDSDFEGGLSDGSDSGGEYAPGSKRKNSRVKASRSKRRRKSESDSEVELGLFSSGGDDSSDDSDEEEVPLLAKLTGKAPTTLPELQAQAIELQAELDEKIPIVQTLKKDEKYSHLCKHCHSLLHEHATELAWPLMQHSIQPMTTKRSKHFSMSCCACHALFYQLCIVPSCQSQATDRHNL